MFCSDDEQTLPFRRRINSFYLIGSIESVNIGGMSIPYPTSAYKVLHRCLEMSNRKDWCPTTVEFFDEARGLSFSDWWKMCSKSAFEQLDPYILNVYSAEQIPRIADDYVPGFDMVVMFNSEQPKYVLVRAFKELLSDAERSPGNPPIFDARQK